MEKPYLLHMITPEKISVHLMPTWHLMLVGIQLFHIQMSLWKKFRRLFKIQSFQRSPSTVSKRTAIFIGGRDTHIAMDMLEETKKHMVPPFEVPVFADPSGAFTTAAGMVAKTEKALKDKFNLDFENLKIAILGGTGPVGVASAVISSKAGNDVILIGRNQEENRESSRDV